jgi:A/G-specific adenine glycosylase
LSAAADDAGDFAGAVLEWYERHGRTDLPWQGDATPYRVWVSEVMLQQTQVGVVIGYFERFVGRFPDVRSLAGGPIDEVLHLWSGLGYYSRARNLHRAAKLVCDRHGGAVPEDIAALRALPGIGRSTAGAILALARGLRHPILDGNVKRVLARYHGVEGWPGHARVAASLWSLAEAHTPCERVSGYTQAMMDLGATVCTRTRPRCDACPLAGACCARIEGRQAEFPARKAPRMRPLRRTVFVIVRDGAGQVLLERRPPSGVWGGLWSFPECDRESDVAQWCEDELGLEVRTPIALAPFSHGFTHFELQIQPVLAHSEGARPPGVRETARHRWFDPARPSEIGLPAPVRRLLELVAVQS